MGTASAAAAASRFRDRLASFLRNRSVRRRSFMLLDVNSADEGSADDVDDDDYIVKKRESESIMNVRHAKMAATGTHSCRCATTAAAMFPLRCGWKISSSATYAEPHTFEKRGTASSRRTSANKRGQRRAFSVARRSSKRQRSSRARAAPREPYRTRMRFARAKAGA